MDHKPATGDDPLKYPDPLSLFMIYLARDANHSLIVRHLHSPVFSDRLAEETTLLSIARRGKPHPLMVGKNFAGLNWRFPTYITIVVDVAGYDFASVATVGYDPIVFRDEKKRNVNGTIQTLQYDPNWSFYNGDIGTLDNFAAFRMTNYHKADAAGNDLPTPKDQKIYCMDIYLLEPFGGGGGSVTSILDPDGQNQGPDGLTVP